MKDTKKLSDRILNQLKHGKTADGRVGCKIKAIGEANENLAWLTIVLRKGYDLNSQPYPIGFEVEYLEISFDFKEDLNGMDYDHFLKRKDIRYNIKDERELEIIIGAWLDDFSIIEPVANISHPVY